MRFTSCHLSRILWTVSWQIWSDSGIGKASCYGQHVGQPRFHGIFRCKILMVIYSSRSSTARQAGPVADGSRPYRECPCLEHRLLPSRGSSSYLSGSLELSGSLSPRLQQSNTGPSRGSGSEGSYGLQSIGCHIPADQGADRVSVCHLGRIPGHPLL